MSQLEIATSIVKRLQDAGHTAYFAGGWVRDYLMRHPSDDIDIVTSASVEEIAALFSKTIPVGIAFGIQIVVEKEHPFEVATFRKESEHLDGRRPSKIEPATPKEDALRRDFTINGMFYDPMTKEIFDYTEGYKDITKHLVRAIGDPQLRFAEDRLRMIRAVRYACRFSFAIEQQTRAAILHHASELFPSVAIERVVQEFEKMAAFPHFDKALRMLFSLGLLQIIFPSLETLDKEALKEKVLHLEKMPRPLPMAILVAELFDQEPLEIWIQECERLKLSGKQKQLLIDLHAFEQLGENTSDYHTYATLYAKKNAPLCINILAARSPDPDVVKQQHSMRQEFLAESIRRIEEGDPVVTSQKLRQYGVLPSKQMGELIQRGAEISNNEQIFESDEIIRRLLDTSG